MPDADGNVYGVTWNTNTPTIQGSNQRTQAPQPDPEPSEVTLGRVPESGDANENRARDTKE